MTSPTRSAIRFGIIGCGGAALPVCEAIHRSAVAELALACDANLALAEDIGRRYGIPFTGEAEAVLSAVSVDALYIAVPHDLLAPLARRALAAGKHALVEKPLALSLADADGLIELAAAQKLALGVFYELRYAGIVALAREMVQGGALGRLTGVRIQTLIDKSLEYWQAGYTGRAVSPWRGQKARAGGGVVLMNSSHLLDAVRYVTGLEVTRVSAEVGALVASVEVEDTAAVAFRYESGAIGSLFSGAHIPGASEAERFDLYGTEGQLIVPDPYRPGALRFYLKRAWGGFEPGQWHTVPAPETEVYGAAVDDFARAALAGRPAPISGHDARSILALLLALYRAAEEGRAISPAADRRPPYDVS